MKGRVSLSKELDHGQKKISKLSMRIVVVVYTVSF